MKPGMPSVKNVMMTYPIRTRDGSRPKYSAIPPRIPSAFRPFRIRCSRFGSSVMGLLPASATLSPLDRGIIIHGGKAIAAPHPEGCGMNSLMPQLLQRRAGFRVWCCPLLPPRWDRLQPVAGALQPPHPLSAWACRRRDASYELLPNVPRLLVVGGQGPEAA